MPVGWRPLEADFRFVYFWVTAMKLLEPSKLSLPLMAVIGLLSAAAGAAGTYTAAKVKLDETAAGLLAAQADVKKAQEDVHALELAHAEERGDVQARLKNIENALERIERWAGTK